MLHFYKLFFFCLVISLESFGQADSLPNSISKVQTSSKNNPKCALGIIGGPNIYSFEDKNSPPTIMAGISGGLDFQYNFGKHSSIILDLFWERKTFGYTSYYGKRKYSFESFTLPVMYRGSIGKKNIFYLNAGIYITHHTLVTAYTPYNITSSELNIGYAGFVGGVGAKIPLGQKFAVSIEARNNFSIGKIYEPDHTYTSNKQSDHSNTTNFLIGLSYGFGQRSVKTSSSNSDSLSAVPFPYKKLEIGIESGVNFTTINGRSTWDHDVSRRNGITSGLNFQYNFKTKLSLQTAAYYTIRNYNSPYHQRKYGSLTIPLLVKAHFGKKRTFYIAGGGFTEMLLSEKIESSTPYYYYTEALMSKKPYLGAVVGMGFIIPLKENLSLSLDAKYWTGRTKDINKAGMTINTQSLLLGLKYSLGENISHVSKSNSSKAEKKDSIKKEKNKVYFKAFYATQVTYRYKTSEVSAFYSTSLHGDSWTTFGYKSEIEIPTMGSEFGVVGEFVQSKHWNINIGATIDNQGFVTKESTFYIYYDSRVGPVMSQHTVDTLENEKITYKYNFLTVPFIVNYQVKIKRTSLYIGLGIEPKLLLKSNISFSDNRYSGLLNGDGYSYDDDEKKLTEKLSGIVFASSHIGACYSFKEHLSLFIEPDAKIAIGHTNKISQLWSYGCRVGLKF